MTFNNFSNKNSFDDIQDPIKNSWGQYWYLNTHQQEPYCWNIGVFTDEEIQNIITIGKRLELNRSRTGANNENCLEHRRSFNSWIHPNEYTSWIYQRLTDLVMQNNQNHFNFDLTMIECLQFAYYNANENGCYKSHIDSNSWNLPHNRKLSIVVQLSNPEDYDGGEIKLYFSHEPTIIKKERGLVINFPSYTLHEVTPVTRGERYSLVAWVHGTLFK